MNDQTALRTVINAVISNAKFLAAQKLEGELALEEKLARLNDKDILPRALRRPGSKTLREKYKCIVSSSDGTSSVFENGYVLYDNGKHKTVLWLLDIPKMMVKSMAFTPKELRPYKITEEDPLAGLIGDTAWIVCIYQIGERIIERNGKYTADSDKLVEDETMEKRDHWTCGTHFDDPLTALLKKEAREERIASLKNRQKEVYTFYGETGYTQEETAEELGITRNSVHTYWRRIREKFREAGRENFPLSF